MPHRKAVAKAWILVPKAVYDIAMQTESAGFNFWTDVVEYEKTPKEGMVALNFSNLREYNKAKKFFDKHFTVLKR